MTFPTVYDMLAIPAGGYQNPNAAAKQALADFDGTSAWGPKGSNDVLQDAIGIMFQLKSKASPERDGFYGPDSVVPS